MVRKRGPLDRIERIMSKKRRVNSTSDATPPMNEDKNLLNNRMLSLYKEDIAVKVKAPNTAVKDKAPLRENEGILNEMNVFENTKKTPKPECSKITTKVADTSVKKKSSVLTLEHSSITFDDVAGLDELLDELLESFNHIIDHQLFTRLGIQPVRGLLLHGPPGCGKTHLAQALAGELGLPYIEVAATELVDGISGESESNIRDIFDEAVKSSPCILFIDEIDAVSPKRETTEKGMEKRMVNQFLKCFDELNKKDAQVMVIGATNKPDFMDPALRRGGRFEEIAIGMPDETARLKILHVMCKNLKFAPDFDMQWLARHTPGYAGADLKSLITQAVKVGLRRFYKKLMSSYFSAAQTSNSLPNIRLPDFGLGPDSGLGGLVRFRFRSKQKTPEEEYENIIFELQDFQVALRKCVPCSKREGFADVPNATWDDVGALNDVKKQLQAAILWPVRYRELYESLNYSTPKGYLLYGPKGCGKTLLAKAIANECSINFLSVKGPEFLSMYVGESEKAVRQCFQRAKSSAPCVIFFDEIDAICSNRSDANLNPAADRVVTQLLTEMDGIEDRKEVFVVAATNRLEKIDAAMLRPGRLEKIIYVDVPNSDGRVEILKRITKNKTRPKIADDVDLELIGQDYRCENFSGADLAHLVREATTKVLDDCINSEHVSSKELAEINFEHFQHAFTVVKPSITEADRKYYRSLVRRYM